jgi:hypothetical protein
MFANWRGFTCLVSGVFLASIAAPAATIFSDQSAFVAALQPGFYLEDFSGFSGGFLSAPHDFSQGGFAYTASATQGLFVVSSISNALSTNVSNDPLTFDFTSGNVTAVGGLFYPTALDGSLATGNIELALSDGTDVNLTDPGITSFTGFITSGGVLITSLTVSPQSTQFATVDNFYVGAAATPEAVPEPSMGAFLGLILLAIACMRALSRARIGCHTDSSL